MHDDKTCGEYQESVLQKEKREEEKIKETEASEKSVKEFSKACVNCKVRIQKNGGEYSCALRD
jgi:hypothetical protein